MLRNLILHIGPMKTGSTSIQVWLHQHAVRLAKQGFYFPTSLGGPNHSRLAYLAQGHALGVEFGPQDEARLTAFSEEIDRLDESIHTLILSGEMMGQTLDQLAEVQSLRTLLAPMFDTFKIILYLRRQDDLSLSRYSTALRRGERRARPLSKAIDYDLVLSLWSRVFGRENVRPRLFVRETLVGGDVVSDFADAVGLTYEPSEEGPIDQNPSLLPQAQAFLADLARQVRDAGFEGQFNNVERHEEINRVLSSTFAGKGMRPARAEAIAFYDQVRESNERVRAEWFPERETLFSEDFDTYPVVEEREPRPRDKLEVAMAVLVSLITPRGVGGTPTSAKDREALLEIRREKRRLKQGSLGAEIGPRARRNQGRRAQRREDT